MNVFKRAWLKVKAGLQYASHFEPARVRAVWVAAAALAATLGLTKEYTAADAKVQALLGALAVILPLLQGELTRAKVTAPGNLEPVRPPNVLPPGAGIGDSDSIEPTEADIAAAEGDDVGDVPDSIEPS